MPHPAAAPGRGYGRVANGAADGALPMEDDSGDISLSLRADERPLAAGALHEFSMPVARRAASSSATDGAKRWPGVSGTMRSSSARPERVPEGDVAERPRSATSSHCRSPSPGSSSPSPTRTPVPSRLRASPASPSSPLSPLHNRRITRSRSLNVRIPSVDLTAKAAQSATSATHELAVPIAPPAPSPRPPPLIDDETAHSMARWVKEIVVCNFDLERGPVVERRAGGRRWGPGVKENVAFSSFPDTSLFTEGSIQFSFKIRHVPPDPSELAYPEPPSPNPGAEALPPPPARRVRSRDSTVSEGGVQRIPEPGRDRAAEYRKWDERGREWMYGFVWFQQRRDRGIARGYMQKSVVILTHLPFPALWSAVLSHLAPAFFAHGYSALEVACHGIASWPDPVPDARLDLGLLSEVLSVKLPDGTENPQVGWGPEPILAAHPPSSPLRAFSSFISHLWSIWECLVLAEPVLVIAPDPRTCSEIVWWLRELLRPIPLAGDFRPYLHIHDHDFSLLVNSNKPQAGVVVGVTNPFFRNAASHWPNVIAVPTKGNPRPGPQQRVMPEHPDGFISKRQRSVQKDRVLLKQLEALISAGKYDDRAGNAALRTHFQQLTERFLVPLNRYFQTLVPPPSSGASTPQRPPLSRPHSFTAHPSSTTLPVPPPPPAVSLNGLKPFSLPSFLEHLKKHGPNPLLFKSKGLASKVRVENDFYAAFCRGACFAGWLAARVESLGLAVASSLSVPPAQWGRRASGDSGMLSTSTSTSASASARVSAETTQTRASGETSGASGASGASTSDRSSVDASPAAPTPKARGAPLLPTLGKDENDENAERRLRRLEIGDSA